MRYILACSIALLFHLPSFAQMVDVTEGAPETGKEKAQEYFQIRKNAPAAAPSRAPAAEGLGAPRYLAVHVGSFFSDNAYSWTDSKQEDIGKLNAGVTYRLGEWVNSMDLALRVDYTSFSLDGGEGDARKLSFGAVVTFPDANSAFPLYFGVGAGAGFFLKQADNESVMALDYSVLAGVRFFNVFETTGFMFETGLKNHLHLFSDGQYNGVFFNVGTVFAF